MRPRFDSPGLGRRLALPGFADLEAETDDTILAGTTRRSRVPWASLIAAPSGVAPADTPGPGWLIPKRLPRGTLDLAPPELVEQFREWQAAPSHACLVLVNHRELRQTNSMLCDAARPPGLLMHPDDCRRLGFTPGQPVLLTSATGSTTAALEVTESIRPGVVSLPHGWSTPGVNRLTSATEAVDPLTGMPRLGGFPVTVTAQESFA